jgi:hypothetical protein
MSRSGQLVASVVVSLSLVASSTAAVASTAASQQQVDPWVALSAMTGGAPAAALCGAAVSAAQPAVGCVLPQGAVVPPPPPPPALAAALPVVGPEGSMWPLFAALAAVAGLDIYLLSRHHHYTPTPVPISPA